MLYFAYGSNLHWEQMKNRCPSARFVCVAKLAGYRLAFTRFSDRRRCGVADVIETEGNEVWGVVYQLDECDFGPLDDYEGHVPGRRNNAYERIELRVLRNGNAAQPTAAWNETPVICSAARLKVRTRSDGSVVIRPLGRLSMTC